MFTDDDNDCDMFESDDFTHGEFDFEEEEIYTLKEKYDKLLEFVRVLANGMSSNTAAKELLLDIGEDK